jgi:hypothetical protein
MADGLGQLRRPQEDRVRGQQQAIAGRQLGEQSSQMIEAREMRHGSFYTEQANAGNIRCLGMQAALSNPPTHRHPRQGALSLVNFEIKQAAMFAPRDLEEKK